MLDFLVHHFTLGLAGPEQEMTDRQSCNFSKTVQEMFVFERPTKPSLPECLLFFNLLISCIQFLFVIMPVNLLFSVSSNCA